ncbi:MAG: DUF4139 domain-containing protein [Bacteroidales bacterium]|nr:DUF4139 domain-containing protein [Bacteroidales bacterium]
MKKLLLLSLAAFYFINVFAQSDFTSQKIAVFKNGTGYFIKTGKIDAPSGKYTLTKTPEALFGTFWISAREERIKNLHTTKEKGFETETAKNVKNMLAGNVGKSVKIFVHTNQVAEGKIFSVNDEMVVIQGKDKWITRAVNDIASVEFLEKPNFDYNKEIESNQMVLEFEKSGKKTLDMMYLQRGISWFPSYLIEISDEKEAVITLKSTLINDVEDLENAEIEFVVGVPNFKYNYVKSPLCSPQTLEEFISSLNGLSYSYRGAMNFDNSNVFSNAIMSQEMNRPEQVADFGGDVAYAEFEAEGSSQEDMFFYNFKNINLKKGERASYELLNTKVPFEHIYEVILNPNTTSNYYYANSKGYSFDDSQNKVWHSIKLKNTSKMPWTTGTAMVVKKENGEVKPISQDMMKYTPSQSNGFLKITVSPDISVKDKEEEVKRTEKAKKKDNSYYDFVTVEGIIKAKNYKKTSVKVSVQRSVTGEMKDSNITWDVAKKLNSANYYNINPTNDVSWELELKPGEEKEIKYSYTIYIYN